MNCARGEYTESKLETVQKPVTNGRGEIVRDCEPKDEKTEGDRRLIDVKNALSRLPC